MCLAMTIIYCDLTPALEMALDAPANTNHDNNDSNEDPEDPALTRILETEYSAKPHALSSFCRSLSIGILGNCALSATSTSQMVAIVIFTTF